MTVKIRQPIIVLVGHVDHGKTTILDFLRKSSIAKHEAGGITQKISSFNIPLKFIKDLCGSLLEKLNIKVTIPGFLIIDTPGHASFNNLRKRGGNLADIAILVIDVNEGLKPQTLEAIDILKNYKTPFVIALNKIDLIRGWNNKKTFLIENINKQSDEFKESLDKKLYSLVGELYKLGFNADRFDRVNDYTKQIAIIPVSAKEGIGIAELFMVLTGLAQRYLEASLETNVKDPGKGAILEVKEEKGLGIILDSIIYDGNLSINDQIVIGGVDKAIVTKIRSLLVQEDKRLINVDEVNAAVGVKILAPNIKDVVAGMPFIVANKNVEDAEREMQKEVEEVLIETDNEGIVVKAESLGSLEALIALLKEKNIPIKRASIGNIVKKDIMAAKAEKNKIYSVVLGFNVQQEEKSDVKVITNNIIYKLIEDLEKWQNEERKELERKELENVVKPCKLQIMHGHIFRQSNPAVFGVDVVLGNLEKVNLIKKDGSKVGEIKDIQLEGKSINNVGNGKQVAISVPGITVDRQVKEGDFLYSDLNEEEFRKLKKLKRFLNSSEIEALKEIAEIKRKQDSLWGI